jgi:hypothetical protein
MNSPIRFDPPAHPSTWREVWTARPRRFRLPRDWCHRFRFTDGATVVEVDVWIVTRTIWERQPEAVRKRWGQATFGPFVVAVHLLR